jgi:hypothetical protein
MNMLLVFLKDIVIFSSIRFSFLVLFSLWITLGNAQENLTAYLQPQVVLNYPVSKKYSHTFLTLYRSYLVNERHVELKLRHIYLTHFSRYQISENYNIGLGITYGFRDVFENSANEFRLTQQLSKASRKSSKVGLAHRFRSEQRFIGFSTLYRFRYRLSMELPKKE